MSAIRGVGFIVDDGETGFGYNLPVPNKEQLSEFVAWHGRHITGDEKGQAQIFLDRLFQAFGQPGVLDVGGQTEFRVRKNKGDGGGVNFADLVWKPVVLVEMKKRGEKLQRHYRQAFDYWTRTVPATSSSATSTSSGSTTSRPISTRRPDQARRNCHPARHPHRISRPRNPRDRRLHPATCFLISRDLS